MMCNTSFGIQILMWARKTSTEDRIVSTTEANDHQQNMCPIRKDTLKRHFEEDHRSGHDQKRIKHCCVFLSGRFRRKPMENWTQDEDVMVLF